MAQPQCKSCGRFASRERDRSRLTDPCWWCERCDLQKARYGARTLDQLLGRGWRRKIRRRKLNMSVPMRRPDGCGCIIAQLVPGKSFQDGARELGIVAGAVVWNRLDELGFAGDVSTETWLRVLREGDKKKASARVPSPAREKGN